MGRVFIDYEFHADGATTAKLNGPYVFDFFSRNDQVATGGISEAMTTAILVLSCCAHTFEISVIRRPLIKELEDKALVLVFYAPRTGNKCSSFHIIGVACTYFIFCAIKLLNCYLFLYGTFIFNDRTCY